MIWGFWQFHKIWIFHFAKFLKLLGDGINKNLKLGFLKLSFTYTLCGKTRIKLPLQCGKMKNIHCHWNFFTSNQLFSKYVIFTKFLPKMYCGEHFGHANFFPSNQLIVKFFSKTLIWRNFYEKIMAVKDRNFRSLAYIYVHNICPV